MGHMLSTSEFAAHWGISTERVRQLCKSGRIQKAQLLVVGASSVWAIPEDAVDPRRKLGRPKAVAAQAQAKAAAQPLFKKIPVDRKAALKRLKDGRRDAHKIIHAMAEKGVTVELFGSMQVGNAHQFSDIDLLITDCGPLDPAIATYEMELLAGDIPVDVTILAYVPKRSLECVMETVHA